MRPAPYRGNVPQRQSYGYSLSLLVEDLEGAEAIWLCVSDWPGDGASSSHSQ